MNWGGKGREDGTRTSWLKVSEMKNHGRSRLTTLRQEDTTRATSGVIGQEKEEERITSNPSADGNFEVEKSGIERKILFLYSFFNFQPAGGRGIFVLNIFY